MPHSKAKRHVSPPRLKQTSDVTIFLETDKADAHTDSLPDLSSVHTIPPSREIQHKYHDQVGCIFHNQTDPEVPTAEKLRAIEAEIERYTAEVKHQKAIDHLSAQGRVEDEGNSQHSGQSETQPTRLGTVLLGKASSLDMETKQRLVRPDLKPSVNKMLHIPTKKKLARRIQKQLQSEEAVLKINPFRVNKKLDLLELREMYHQSKRSRPHELPTIKNPQARIQYQVFNDNRLLCPVFKFRMTKYLEGGKQRIQASNLDFSKSKKSEPVFRFRDVPQLLAVTRKNRRMYCETKWDVVTRIREMNQCNISLAIKRRMIDYLNKSVVKFDKDIVVVEEETENFAKAFDEYLHENDEKAIVSIERAREAVSQRVAAEQSLKEAQMHNTLLRNHNLRTEEKIHFLDRFINVLYASLPSETCETYLAIARSRKEGQNSQGTVSLNIPGNTTAYNPVAESLEKFTSLSEESEDEYEKENTLEENGTTVPPLPVSRVEEAMQLLADTQQQCANACYSRAEAREETDILHDQINQETVEVDETLTEARLCLGKLEKEVSVIENTARVAALIVETEKLPNKDICIDQGLSNDNREVFRRPIGLLEDQIRQIYQTYISSAPVHPTTSTMLAAIRRKVHNHASRFHDYPPKFVQKWYQTVQSHRIAEQRAVNNIEKRERWEQLIKEKSIQHPDVMPRRQLRPRSVPRDHGKAVAVVAIEPLDKIVEVAEAAMGNHPQTGYTSSNVTLDVDEKIDESGTAIKGSRMPDDGSKSTSSIALQKRKIDTQVFRYSDDSEEETSGVGLTATETELPVDSEVIHIVSNNELTASPALLVPTTEETEDDEIISEPEATEEKQESDSAGEPLPKGDQDYPDDVLLDDNDHPRLDDIFASLDNDEVPAVKNKHEPHTPSDPEELTETDKLVEKDPPVLLSESDPTDTSQTESNSSETLIPSTMSDSRQNSRSYTHAEKFVQGQERKEGSQSAHSRHGSSGTKFGDTSKTFSKEADGSS